MRATIREMLQLRHLTNKSQGPPHKAGTPSAPSFFGDQEMKHREGLLIWRMVSPSEPSAGFSEWSEGTSAQLNWFASRLVKHLDKPSWLFVGLGHAANQPAAFEFNTPSAPKANKSVVYFRAGRLLHRGPQQWSHRSWHCSSTGLHQHSTGNKSDVWSVPARHYAGFGSLTWPL